MCQSPHVGVNLTKFGWCVGSEEPGKKNAAPPPPSVPSCLFTVLGLSAFSVMSIHDFCLGSVGAPICFTTIFHKFNFKFKYSLRKC